MSSKHKRIRLIDDYCLDCDTVTLRKTTYNNIKKRFKIGSYPLTVKFFRDLLVDAKYVGLYKRNDIEGHHFINGDNNIIVSKGYNLFVSAFKTKQQEQPDNNISPEIKDDDNLSVKSLEEGKIKIGEDIYDLDGISISEHTKLRMRQRYYITDLEMMKKFCLDIITTGIYAGLQLDKELKEDELSHMFVKNGVILHICQGNFETITIYNGDLGYYDTAKELFIPMIESKLTGAQRTYKKVERECKYEEWRIRREIIELEETEFKTRSKNKKEECKKLIETKVEEIKLLEENRNKAKQRIKDLKHLYGCLA